MNHRFHWHKSSYSDGHGGNCVEVRERITEMDLRDSQHPRQGHLTVPAPEWRAFLAAVREREL